MLSLIPSLADMDNDGDFDLVCGNSIGQLVYCENTALPGQPADFKLIDMNWQSIDVGDFAAPQLLDLDTDGLVDLVCGKRNGTLSFYKNTGIPQEADFILVTDKFGGVDVTDPQLSNYGYSVPCFYRDKQGETILFAGSEYGDVFVYSQINNNLAGDFNLMGILPSIKEGWRSSTALGNLNNDTLTDLLVGNYSGGLSLFFGKPDKIFGISEPNVNKFSSLKIVPNPARNEVSIDRITNKSVKPESMLIQGMDGKVVRKYSKVNFPMLVDVSGFENGIYLISVQTVKGISTGKLVICR
jgi:hypothetical protein